MTKMMVIMNTYLVVMMNTYLSSQCKVAIFSSYQMERETNGGDKYDFSVLLTMYNKDDKSCSLIVTGRRNSVLEGNLQRRIGKTQYMD